MKALHLLLIPALAAMAVSCSTNDDVPQPRQQADGITTVRGTTAYTPVDATRTLFTATTGDDGLTDIGLTWGDDPTKEYIDVVGFHAGGTPMSSISTFPGVTRSTNGKSMEFNVSSGYPTGIVEKYVYLYPSKVFILDSDEIVVNRASRFTAEQIQTGKDNLAHLSAVNWMYSNAVDAEEDFTLNPLGAILRFDLTFPTAVTGGTITLSSNEGSFISDVLVNYSGGKASFSMIAADKSQSLTISGLGETGATNVIAYMMVGAADDHTELPTGTTLTLTAEMTTADKTSNTYTHTLGTTKSDAEWVPGTCYNFTVTAAGFTTWAASNIYWDDVNKRLTFDLPGATTANPYRQGVFFKWGSLVGISPAQTPSAAWTGNEIVYVPTYNSVESKWEWPSSPTTATAEGYKTYTYDDDNPNGIPYENATGLSTSTSVNNLYYADVTAPATKDKWAAKIGDICQFLGATNPALAGYRMPRQEEFGTSGDWATPAVTSGTILNDANGTADLAGNVHATWTATGAIFPASGNRGTDGALFGVGNNGYYWSSSTNNDSFSRNMQISNKSVTLSSGSGRQFAYPVRCVKN